SARKWKARSKPTPRKLRNNRRRAWLQSKYSASALVTPVLIAMDQDVEAEQYDDHAEDRQAPDQSGLRGRAKRVRRVHVARRRRRDRGRDACGRGGERCRFAWAWRHR